MADANHEIVIIRRRGPFEDGPAKGGVWKIAYADFMTAMMAFFLVMWLVNVLNQSQRESVANYFNPIKLAETSPSRKGLNDPAKADPDAAEPHENKQDSRESPAAGSEVRRGDSPTAEKPPHYDEKVLFRDPYAVLSEIVSTSDDASGRHRMGGAVANAQEEGMKGGEAYRDPFDPSYWKLFPQGRSQTDVAERTDPDRAAHEENSGPSGPSELRSTVQGRPDATTVPVAARSEAPPDGASFVPAPAPASKETNAKAAAPADANEARPRDAAPVQMAAKQLQAAVNDALADLQPGSRPVTEVRQVEEGLLISLTDDASFGMFSIGSAEPRPELVRVIDKIGPLLTKHAGAIVIRGHTDNRPYRSAVYDNWRLSTARAQMAYYMLVRAGVDPQRIEHVEGYADRRPKLPSDPAAAPNRRIEILIRERQS
jgi:chemotaxis protein MotB